jgi:ABC-type antimicrobial peptide transport system permease subunit
LRPLRVACLAGFAAALMGALVLALTFLLGPQEGGTAWALQVFLSLAGLLLASGGLFLCACTAAVLVAGYLSRPRLAPRRG